MRTISKGRFMTLNREEIIREMAGAIRLVNLYGDFDPHEYIEGSTKLAEAALDALVDALPESIAPAHFLREQEWAVYYKQLLSLKRE